MCRLPIRFEKEVLQKHEIFWRAATKTYLNTNTGEDCSKYEIAGIALEAMPDLLKEKESLELGFYNWDERWWQIYAETWEGEEVLTSHDNTFSTDFCKCVFKTVEAVYVERLGITDEDLRRGQGENK